MRNDFNYFLLSGVLPAITMQQWRSCCITMMYTALKALVSYCWTFMSDNAQAPTVGFYNTKGSVEGTKACKAWRKRMIQIKKTHLCGGERTVYNIHNKTPRPGQETTSRLQILWVLEPAIYPSNTFSSWDRTSKWWLITYQSVWQWTNLPAMVPMYQQLAGSCC